MHYVKDLFEKRQTEHAHNKFVRYSKGKFTGPLISISIQKNNIKFNGSFHISNEILMLLGEYFGNKEIEIKGTLSWNKDLSPDLANIGIMYLKVTKSRGIFNYILENKVKLKEFVDTLVKYNLLVSFKEDDIKLTTKNKFPKPNKEISNDFVKAILPISLKDRVLDEFAFDCKKCKAKKIEIAHDIIIEDIHLPQVEDFEVARKQATREGTLIRRISLDGAEPVETKIHFNI
jgi:hypothetical protein